MMLTHHGAHGKLKLLHLEDGGLHLQRDYQLNRFFHRYCGSFKYKEKLVEGAQRFHLDGSPASLVTRKEVPVIVSKPRFNKKSKNVTDTTKTVSNEIKPTQ